MSATDDIVDLLPSEDEFWLNLVKSNLVKNVCLLNKMI